MPYRGTEAEKRAVREYQKRQDNIMIRPTKEKGAEIRAAAKAAGQSVQAYLLQAANERMCKDRTEEHNGN